MQNKAQMRIKIDIDNVIRNMSKEMVDIYNEMFGERMTVEDICCYDVRKAFPKFEEAGMDARHEFFSSKRYRTFFLAEQMPDAISGIRKLKEMGHEIIIVSYQPDALNRLYTIEWIKKNQVPFDNIVLLDEEDKTHVKADYIIDDNPKFLDMDSAKKVCIDWAYNRTGKYDYRVKSILEFANSI